MSNEINYTNFCCHLVHFTLLIPSISLSPTSAMAVAPSIRGDCKSEGLLLIQKELEASCPSGLVNREGVVQLCEHLRYDRLDKQV